MTKMNLVRRAALKAIIGSPIAAKGIAQAAAEALTPAADFALGLSSEGSPKCISGDPLFELYQRHQGAHMRRLASQREGEIKHFMPEKVASKKSWSPAFKAHAAVEHMRESEMWDTYSDEGRIRALVSIGILPASLLGDEE